MLNLVVERSLKSYQFKVNPNLASSFSNNYKNNSLDKIIIYDDNAEIAAFRCQTVANYCWGDYKSNGPTEWGDTVSEGYFKIKCFVEPRKFHGEIHGIIETKDLDGQVINHDSMQIENGYQTGRWLIHDRYSSKTGKDTNYAWSAGCFILSSDDLKAFNDILHAYQVQAGDIISGELIEVE